MGILPDELRAYELSLPRDKRKRLGQFFTQPNVARLLAALSIQSAKSRIVDTMAGHGNLLDAAADRQKLAGGQADFLGVEIDQETARLCNARLQASVTRNHQKSARTICESAFNPEMWINADASKGFDLVIGNPPYVRYQSLINNREDIRSNLRIIAETISPDEERPLWSHLIDAYSGLADLSLPSWLLSSLLCRPHGILALVVPQTWMTRDYARLIRYVQLRFFRPLYVVEEHGVAWFADALVPTTLIISQRLSPSESTVPLQARSFEKESVVRIGIPASAGDGVGSLVNKAFPSDDPEGEFVSWINRGIRPHPMISAQREPIRDECHRVLSVIRAQRWTSFVEGSVRNVRTVSAAEKQVPIPNVVTKAIAISPRVQLASLNDLGIKIGQGLRTGCNAFFYLDRLPTKAKSSQFKVRASQVFSHQEFELPREVVKRVVRRQAEVSGFVVRPSELCGIALDLRRWFLPEDAKVVQQELFSDDDSCSMPESLANYVRTAAVTSVERNGRKSGIPFLTAVITNERPNSFGAPRRWYMLPDFAPRHIPLIFVPRINDGTTFFVENSSEPVLVDANFSTIFDRGAAPSNEALLALLNSTWVRANCEALGTPLGAGALKLEATQLKELMVPVLGAGAWGKLAALGTELKGYSDRNATRTLASIDRIVVRALLGDTRSDNVSAACKALTLLIGTLQRQRQRKGKTRD